MMRVLMLLPLFVCVCFAAELPEPVVLWPDGAPFTQDLPNKEVTVERSKDPAKPNRSTRQVTQPAYHLYPAPNPPEQGAPAVVICPGGGYGGLAIDKEGHDVARWLNSLGITGIVLKYRMPRVDLTKDGEPLPLTDANRMIRLARENASQWHINPTKVGVLGFSAGGHLAAATATGPEKPNFAVLIYPVISMDASISHGGSRRNLLGKSPSAQMIKQYSNELRVSATTPPTFLVHAADDGVKIKNSEVYVAACKRASVPVHFVRFDKGGHGFGLGVNGGPPATWPKQCANWFREIKVVDK